MGKHSKPRMTTKGWVFLIVAFAAVGFFIPIAVIADWR